MTTQFALITDQVTRSNETVKPGVGKLGRRYFSGPAGYNWSIEENKTKETITKSVKRFLSFSKTKAALQMFQCVSQIIMLYL